MLLIIAYKIWYWYHALDQQLRRGPVFSSWQAWRRGIVLRNCIYSKGSREPRRQRLQAGPRKMSRRVLMNWWTHGFSLHERSKAAVKLYIFGRLRRQMSYAQALRVYKTKMLPYMEYGGILVHDTNKTLLTKLQRLQNRGLKIALYSPPRTSIEKIHKDVI